ncbi:hypothetical protein [Chitinophaga varians]|uniref:hypothetical protein n=1 Tax=Chitinophaga varians TaxID=2202339 RepID=UPI00165F9609|nr:hypothetical protein [Chitinophaga varians]MBC9908860.1 hypothetical protein [Chitinophaga varians]
MFAQITEKEGSVGIGVSDPTEKLDVNGSILARGGLVSSVPVTENTIGGYLTLQNPSKTQPGEAQKWILFNMTGNSYGNSLQFWAYDKTGCTAGGMCAARFTITDNGRVGIGTTKPQTELSVLGTITTQKIKVSQNGWADYVFDPGYKLPSLAEVQQHINTHKHLPDMPSAAVIEQDGLDLGDMQRKQMQKIEELTLYILQQQKEIEALKAAVKALSNKENKH